MRTLKKHTIWHFFALGGVAALVVSYSVAYEYGILDLGALTNRTSVANAVAGGYLAGTGAISGDYNGEPWVGHACRWSTNVIQDLGVLGPDVPPGVFPKPESQGLGVNSAGRVVGKSAQPGEPWKPFLWLPSAAFGMSAGMNALPELPGGASIAAGINDSDWIVGESRYVGSPGARPVLWRFTGQWTITDIGDLGGPYGRATAVNNSGQITGQANVASGNMHAFLWLPAPAYGLSAGMHDLDPNLGQAYASGINSKGQIVGWAGAGAPWLWLPQPEYGLPAGTLYLNMDNIPNAVGAWPAAISDDGAVTGQVGQRVEHNGHFFTEYHAFIWRSGVAQRLEDLLPPSQPWWLVGGNAFGEYFSSGPTSAIIASYGMSPDHPDMQHGARLQRVLRCDVNCDGVVNFDDINPFVLALSDPAEYARQYPSCTIFNADANGDGLINFDDINAFVQCFDGK